MLNEQSSNWYQNMYQGNITPMGRPRQRNKPALEFKKLLENGDKITQLKVYVHNPTLTFPETGVFIQLYNKSSCYAKLSNVDELYGIANFILESAKLLESKVEELKPLEKQVNLQLDSYSKNLQLMRQMKQLQTEEGNPYGNDVS